MTRRHRPVRLVGAVKVSSRQRNQLKIANLEDERKYRTIKMGFPYVLPKAMTITNNSY